MNTNSDFWNICEIEDPLTVKLCALDLSSAIKTGDSDSRFLWQYIGTIFSPLLRLTGGG